MGHSCLAAAVLGGHTEKDQRACYLYGTYVGQACQLVDDALDFERLLTAVGQVSTDDLQYDLMTAPTFFASGNE